MLIEVVWSFGVGLYVTRKSQIHYNLGRVQKWSKKMGSWKLFLSSVQRLYCTDGVCHSFWISLNKFGIVYSYIHCTLVWTWEMQKFQTFGWSNVESWTWIWIFLHSLVTLFVLGVWEMFVCSTVCQFVHSSVWICSACVAFL